MKIQNRRVFLPALFNLGITKNFNHPIFTTMRKLILSIGFLFIIQLSIKAQAPTDSLLQNKVFDLGEITITTSKTEDQVKQLTLLETNRTDAGQALAMLPSVTLHSYGSRSETAVFVRGFDSRGVPVYIDGIPVYVVYDGYVDLGRFKTFDYSKLTVSKGLTAMEYGANTIGGSINLVSMKPQSKLELQAILGYASGNTQEYSVNLGSRFGKFYLQSSYSQRSTDFVPLSENYIIVSDEEDGEKRENSYSSDQKINLKLGFEPSENSEIALNYIYQKGEKGTPPYVGIDPNFRPRYWQWPNWDKQSIYLLSKTKLTANNQLKFRAYYDEFFNIVKSFDDNTYTTQTMRYAFTSVYDDYTYGSSLVLENSSLNNNTLNFSVHYKTDVHRENNEGEQPLTTADNVISFGLDNIYSVTEKIKLTAGLGYNLRNSSQADTYDENGQIAQFPENKTQALNGQLAAKYFLNKTMNLQFYVAQRTRFATMKNRYSYRMGYSLPNPDLEAEQATHFDLTYRTVLAPKLWAEISAYHILLNNTIQEVSDVEPGVSQMQNTGKAQFTGLDFSANFEWQKHVEISSTYAYIERKNTSNPDLFFTDVPNHSLSGNLIIKPVRNLKVNLRAEYNSDRYSTSYGSVAHEFKVYDAYVSYTLKAFTLNSGVKNIFDESYQFTEGYPEIGRNFFVKLIIDFKKQ